VTLCSLLCNNLVIARAQRLFSGFPQSRPRFNLLLDLVESMMERKALKRNCLRKLRCTLLNHNFCILKCHLGPQYQGTQTHTIPKVMKRSMGTKYLVNPVSGSWKGLSAVRDRPLVDCLHAPSDCVRTHTHTHKPQLFIKLKVIYHEMITRYRNIYFGHKEQRRAVGAPLSDNRSCFCHLCLIPNIMSNPNFIQVFFCIFVFFFTSLTYLGTPWR
jgi:hypothetical protein